MATTFKPSQYSPGSSFTPSRLNGYGDAGGAGATKETSVEVYDLEGTGPFVVRSDGSVTYRGTTWNPGHKDYALVISNLEYVSGNKAKLASVLGTMTTERLVAEGREIERSRPLPPPTGSKVGDEKKDLVPAGLEEVGLWDTVRNHPMFWPGVILTTTTVLAAGAFVFLRYTETGRRLIGSPRIAAPTS